MEGSMTTTANGTTWDIAPTNAIAGIILAVLFIYLFFRHFLFALMIMDAILGWLRRFGWFPKEGKRVRAFIHWLIALGLFFGFLAVAGTAGWLEFTPR